MDKKTQGILATVAAVILCGCPGLVILCSGAVFVLTGVIPGSDIDINGSSDPAAAITTGVVAMCMSIFLIAIPIVVGFLMLREKPLEPIEGEIVEEEIPGDDL